MKRAPKAPSPRLPSSEISAPFVYLRRDWRAATTRQHAKVHCRKLICGWGSLAWLLGTLGCGRAFRGTKQKAADCVPDMFDSVPAGR